MNSIKEKVKNLPLSPGVYLMKDSHGTIIYVGKAKAMKRRVQTYFLKSIAPSQKVEKLKKNIHDFDYILTDTEFEAFLLECQLIKEIKPFFNRRMKSSRGYKYIIIGQHGNQRIDVTSTPPMEGVYFGPFTGKGSIEIALQGLKEFYKIDCSNHSKSQSACLNYSLGFCLGICLGGHYVEQYDNILKKITAFFQGKSRNVLKEMNKQMTEAADRFDFETAARYRDYLDALHSLLKKEKMIEFTEANRNIVIMEDLPGDTFKVFLIKGNQVLYSRIFMQVDLVHIKDSLFKHFKDAETHLLKITQDEIDEAQIIYSYLNSSNCKYLVIPEIWLESKNSEVLGTELKQFFHEKMESV